MNRVQILSFGILALLAVIFLLNSNMPKESIQLISVKKIWESNRHCAFTDLIYFNGKWYCVFRESDSHVGGKDGAIRLLESKDGDNWNSRFVFTLEGIDLRDPKLSLTPDNRLMLLAGGSQYSKEGQFISSQSLAAFSSDAIHWSEFTKILEPNEWLWRVTWHAGVAYGAAYRSTHLETENSDWIATLFSSQDGIHYEKITQLKVPGRPSEGTIRFLHQDEMILLIRRGGKNGTAWIGSSQPPYKDWTWNDSKIFMGGPNFVMGPNHTMWAAGRILIESDKETLQRTILAEMTEDELHPVLDLPSGGEDTGYPGMVYQNGMLWISYYSSHENGKTSIYLAKIKLVLKKGG